MADAAQPKLRWYQYSLRSLLLLMLLASIGMSWVAVRMQRAKRQQAAVEAIGKLGGTAWYDYQLDKLDESVARTTPPGPAWLRSLLGDYFSVARTTPPGPAWLRSLLGDDFFANVVCAVVCSDSGLEHLDDLPQLQVLLLRGTEISDAELEHVKRLTRLQTLEVFGTKISDTGLEHLKGLTQLRELLLSDNKVTKQGVTNLRQALSKCEIIGP